MVVVCMIYFVAVCICSVIDSAAHRQSSQLFKASDVSDNVAKVSALCHLCTKVCFIHWQTHIYSPLHLHGFKCLNYTVPCKTCKKCTSTLSLWTCSTSGSYSLLPQHCGHRTVPTWVQWTKRCETWCRSMSTAHHTEAATKCFIARSVTYSLLLSNSTASLILPWWQTSAIEQ